MNLILELRRKKGRHDHVELKILLRREILRQCSAFNSLQRISLQTTIGNGIFNVVTGIWRHFGHCTWWVYRWFQELHRLRQESLTGSTMPNWSRVPRLIPAETSVPDRFNHAGLVLGPENCTVMTPWQVQPCRVCLGFHELYQLGHESLAGSTMPDWSRVPRVIGAGTWVPGRFNHARLVSGRDPTKEGPWFSKLRAWEHSSSRPAREYFYSPWSGFYIWL